MSNTALNCLNFDKDDTPTVTNDEEGLLLIQKLLEVRNQSVCGTSSSSSVTNYINNGVCKISAENIRRARFHLEGMNKAMLANNIVLFNRSLLMLVSALPRPLTGTIIVPENGMAERLNWEAAFIDAVEAVYLKRVQNPNFVIEAPDVNLVEKYKKEYTWSSKAGIVITKATVKDMHFIRAHMQKDASKLINAWRVESSSQNKRYESYLKEHNIQKTDTLWHGSPTVNFISILENGLSLSRAAYGMFGRGLYFAPAFDKSRGYCSVSGARWRGGTDNSAFLALCDIATGKSLHTSTCSNHGTRDSLEGYDSLWAHKGPQLCRDEVIVYDATAARIRYIVETK